MQNNEMSYTCPECHGTGTERVEHPFYEKVYACVCCFGKGMIEFNRLEHRSL
jgi:DnaJ-class molecular chaperone